MTKNVINQKHRWIYSTNILYATMFKIVLSYNYKPFFRYYVHNTFSLVVSKLLNYSLNSIIKSVP